MNSAYATHIVVPDNAPLGLHLIAEFYGVEAALLRGATRVEALLCESAHAAGAHILQTLFHDFGLQNGVTGVAMLAESHISIHTWPEHGYAAADIFMCGNNADPQRAYMVMKNALKPARCDLRILGRGERLSVTPSTGFC